MLDADAIREFIRTQTQITSTPLLPDIKLHLATDITPIWQATEDWLERKNMPPPFWAFSWPGGQALARYIRDHAELVRGKRVMDFAAGASVASIAAMQAGAKQVTAVEVNVMAREAIMLNTALNNVQIETRVEDIVGRDLKDIDLVLAGDVCYEQLMAHSVVKWLRTQAGRGIEVWLGDPGRAYFPASGYEVLASYEVPVTLELEDRPIRTTRVVRLAEHEDPQEEA